MGKIQRIGLVKPLSVERAKLVDELGQLDATFAVLKFDLARQKFIRAEVAGWADDLKGEETLTVVGKLYSALISARENKRTILNMGKVFLFLGKKLFLENCGFTLGKFDALTEGKLDDQIVTGRTGPRSVDTVPFAA
jgi:hypothetical protein